LSTFTLSGSQFFELASFFVFCVASFALSNVKAGIIYFWMKDITPEFLKIHALNFALDISQKARLCVGSHQTLNEASPAHVLRPSASITED
jgi:hypothetical protein